MVHGVIRMESIIHILIQITEFGTKIRIKNLVTYLDGKHLHEWVALNRSSGKHLADSAGLLTGFRFEKPHLIQADEYLSTHG
jgi:hypothetical protein